MCDAGPRPGRRASAAALAVLAALLFGGSERAAALSCTNTGLTGAYGTVNVLPGTAINTTGSFSVTCSGNANEAIRFCLNIGIGTTGLDSSTGRRTMTYTSGSTHYLDQEFYSNSGRTTVWGTWGIGNSEPPYPTGSPAGYQQDVTLNGSGSGTFSYTVYATIFASQQTVPPGSYVWSGLEPTVQYRDTSGATSCPTNGGSTGGVASSFTATNASYCTVSSTSLDFGASNSAITANIDQTATITVQGTNTTPYSISLDNGTNANGNQRRMRMGATSYYVNYNLYTDSARSHAWGATTSATSCTGGSSTCYLGTGNGTNQNITVYGRVPPQTAPSSGTYNDTVVVTVTY
jgi:spore coat protein U-like protein